MGENNNQPIMQFETDEQMQECLKEWQERLYLQDWAIKYEVKELDDALAEISTIHSLKVATISFHPITEESKKKELLKYCAEKIMVHELNHIIFDVAKFNDGGYADVEFELLQHQKTELMARSLLMAKYGMSADWFKNI